MPEPVNMLEFSVQVAPLKSEFIDYALTYARTFEVLSGVNNEDFISSPNNFIRRCFYGPSCRECPPVWPTKLIAATHIYWSASDDQRGHIRGMIIAILVENLRRKEVCTSGTEYFRSIKANEDFFGEALTALAKVFGIKIEEKYIW